MITYKCNGGRLGENLSFLYGIFKFCKINLIDFSNIVVDIDYKNTNLIKNCNSEYVFKDNIEMFSNVSYIFQDFKDIDLNTFKHFDLNGKSDPAKLKDFYKYNNLNKKDNIVFSNYWSLNPYWYKDDIDYELLNLICKPKNLVKRLQKKYKSILNDSSAIHIRRCDFKCLVDKDILLDKVNYDYYFSKDKVLYNIDDIKKKIEICSIFKNILIFSDDINWCRNNLKNLKDNLHFIDGNKPYEDLILMSMCTNVIVNPGSFFSQVANIINKQKHENIHY